MDHPNSSQRAAKYEPLLRDCCGKRKRHEQGDARGKSCLDYSLPRFS
jgi:hypothetical protein